MRRDGLTLLEVMVALSILLIGLVAVVPAFISFLHVNTHSEVQTQAANLAQTYLEKYRLQDPSTMPPTSNSYPTTSTSPVTVDYQGRTFTVVTTYCADTNYCGPTSRDIKVTVSYANQQVFSAETVYTKVHVN